MIGDTNLFHRYIPSSKNLVVQIVDGSPFQVARVRTVVIINNIILNYVFLVPNLTYNLLPISKITRDLNFVT